MSDMNKEAALAEYIQECLTDPYCVGAYQLYTPYSRRANDRVSLLLVNKSTPPMGLLGVSILTESGLGLILYEVTPNEYQAIKSGVIPLPDNLSLRPCPPTTEQTLATICQKYIKELKIDHPETVYQSDRVIDRSLEWIAELCQALNMYYEES